MRPRVWGSRNHCCAPWWLEKGRSLSSPPKFWGRGVCGCHWQMMWSPLRWVACGVAAELRLAWGPPSGHVQPLGLGCFWAHWQWWKRSGECPRCSGCRSWCRNWASGCASSGCCKCSWMSVCRSPRRKHLRGKPSPKKIFWGEDRPLC